MCDGGGVGWMHIDTCKQCVLTHLYNGFPRDNGSANAVWKLVRLRGQRVNQFS